jgi:hypothetical protein
MFCPVIELNTGLFKIGFHFYQVLPESIFCSSPRL